MSVRFSGALRVTGADAAAGLRTGSAAGGAVTRGAGDTTVCRAAAVAPLRVPVPVSVLLAGAAVAATPVAAPGFITVTVGLFLLPPPPPSVSMTDVFLIAI